MERGCCGKVSTSDNAGPRDRGSHFTSAGPVGFQRCHSVPHPCGMLKVNNFSLSQGREKSGMFRLGPGRAWWEMIRAGSSFFEFQHLPAWFNLPGPG